MTSAEFSSDGWSFFNGDEDSRWISKTQSDIEQGLVLDFQRMEDLEDWSSGSFDPNLHRSITSISDLAGPRAAMIQSNLPWERQAKLFSPKKGSNMLRTFLPIGQISFQAISGPPSL